MCEQVFGGRCVAALSNHVKFCYWDAFILYMNNLKTREGGILSLIKGGPGRKVSKEGSIYLLGLMLSCEQDYGPEI